MLPNNDESAAVAGSRCQLWAYLKQRKQDLPADVQHEITKREVKVSKHLRISSALPVRLLRLEKTTNKLARSIAAFTSLEGLLGKGRHRMAELCQAVLAKHEKDLQERISVTKELFLKGEADLDQAKQEAGDVVDLTVEEELQVVANSGSSAEMMSLSIQNLATSLEKLHSEAAVMVADVPQAKRHRTAAGTTKDEAVGEAAASLPPFGKAGQ